MSQKSLKPGDLVSMIVNPELKHSSAGSTIYGLVVGKKYKRCIAGVEIQYIPVQWFQKEKTPYSEYKTYNMNVNFLTKVNK